MLGMLGPLLLFYFMHNYKLSNIYLTECLQIFPYIFMKNLDLVGEIW